MSVMHTNPLSSANLRYLLRQPVAAAGPGEVARPLCLQFARTVPTPVLRIFRYCPRLQVAVDEKGVPLVDADDEQTGKDWKTKSSSDGDEGVEENWGWEEP